MRACRGYANDFDPTRQRLSKKYERYFPARTQSARQAMLPPAAAIQTRQAVFNTDKRDMTRMAAGKKPRIRSQPKTIPVAPHPNNNSFL